MILLDYDDMEPTSSVCLGRCRDLKALPELCRFLFLFLENFGVRKLEALFCSFIAVMALSFAWMFGETNPDGRAMVSGANVLHLTIFPVCTCNNFLVQPFFLPTHFLLLVV